MDEKTAKLFQDSTEIDRKLFDLICSVSKQVDTISKTVTEIAEEVIRLQTEMSKLTERN